MLANKNFPVYSWLIPDTRAMEKKANRFWLLAKAIDTLWNLPTTDSWLLFTKTTDFAV